MPTYTFTYDSREFYEADCLVQRLVGSRRRWLFVAFYGIVVLLYIVPPLLYGTFNWSLVNFVPLAILTVILVAIGPLARWHKARTLPRRDPSLQGPQQRVLSDEGLQVRGVGVVTSYEWSTIQRAVETTHLFLLFVHPKWAHYLPKRAIPTSAELEQVRALLRSKLGDRFRQLGFYGAA